MLYQHCTEKESCCVVGKQKDRGKKKSHAHTRSDSKTERTQKNTSIYALRQEKHERMNGKNLALVLDLEVERLPACTQTQNIVAGRACADSHKVQALAVVGGEKILGFLARHLPVEERKFRRACFGRHDRPSLVTPHKQRRKKNGAHS